MIFIRMKPLRMPSAIGAICAAAQDVVGASGLNLPGGVVERVSGGSASGGDNWLWPRKAKRHARRCDVHHCGGNAVNGLSGAAVVEEQFVLLLGKFLDPPPEPMITPKRRRSSSGSLVGSSPELARASVAAAIANGRTRETWRRSFFSIQASSSKPVTSPAIWTFSSLGSKRVMRRTPLRPSRIACVNASRPTPFGLTTPIPLITTRRLSMGGMRCRAPVARLPEKHLLTNFQKALRKTRETRRNRSCLWSDGVKICKNLR